MVGRKNSLPMTSEGFDKAAYFAVVAGLVILLIAHFSGALNDLGVFATVFKGVVAFNTVFLFFFFKSRANKLRGLN